MKTKTAAEQLADKIIEYLRTHPNSTQAQMQIALDFQYWQWQEATKFMKVAVVRMRAVKLGGYTYSLAGEA